MFRLFPISAFLLALTGTLVSQTEPNPGPGLGNLSYTGGELFGEISRIGPHDGGSLGVSTSYGYNLAHMVNGYMVTVFAEDGGGVRGDKRGGIQFYDVSNPRSPRHVKTVWDPGGLTARMREIHAMCFARIGAQTLMCIPSEKGIQFWDLADVNNPTRVSLFEFVNGGDYTDTPWQIMWQHPYVYVATGGNGLYIIDASDPANPALATRASGGPNPIPNGQLGGFSIGPIWAMGNRLVVSSMETTAGFSVLDIGSPTDPQLLDSQASIPEFHYSPGFDGKTLAFATRQSDARTPIYTIADDGSITLESHAASPVVPEQLYTSSQDDFVFLGCQAEVVKLDISTPTAPTIVGRGGLSGVSNPDFGQANPFGNVILIGNDHGTGTGFMPHQTAPDSQPPVVSNTSPAANAIGVSVCSRVGIAFSDSLQLESIDKTSIEVAPQVDGSPGTPLDGTYTLQFGIVNFTPDAGFQADTTYTVTVKAGGVTDWAGNAMAADHQFSFRTGNACGQPVVTDPHALQHHWSFNQNTNDLVGTLHGTLENGAARAEGALVLDGIDDHLSLPGSLATLQGSSSLAFYLKTDQTGSDSPWLAPGVTGLEIAGAGGDIFWGWIDASGRLRVSVGNGNSVISTNAINDNVNRHFVLTRDAQTGLMQIYINGVLDSSATGDIGAVGATFSSLGRIEDDGGTPDYLKGTLDEVRIYNSVLDGTDVGTVYSQSQSNLVSHHWKLNTDLLDSGGSLDGTAAGSPVHAEGGLQFDGTDDSVALGGTSQAGSWTLSLFAKRTGSADEQVIFSGSTGELHLSHPGTGNKVGFSGSVGTGFNWDYSIPLDTWVHLVFVREDDSTTTLYADGVSQGNVAGWIDLPLATLGAVTVTTSGGGATTAHVDAVLDDICTFPVAMSAAAIGQLRGTLTVAATPPATTELGNSTSFTGSATSAAAEPTFVWDFGDGTVTSPSYSAAASHSYAAPGHYTVKLTADDRLQSVITSFTHTVVRPLTSGKPVRSGTIAVHGSTAYCVNIDNDTITAVNGVFPFNKLWEQPAGNHPRSIAVTSAGAIWVANKEDATITVHDNTGAVAATHLLPRASRPHGLIIAPDNSAGYASLEATGQVAKINLTTGAVDAIATVGDWPRGLAMSHDSSRLFVTRFISPDSGAIITELDPATLATVRTFTLAPDTSTVDDSFQARGIGNYLNSLTITPDGASAWFPGKKDNIFGGTGRDGNPLTFETSVRPISSTLDIATNNLSASQFIDFNDVGLPVDVEFSSNGGYAFVAIEGSNQIEIRDAFTGNRRGGVNNTGLAPRGLATNTDGSVLFAHHFMGRSVRVYDITEIRDGIGFNMSELGNISTVASEALTPAVLQGKEIFYNSGDSRMSLDAYISCASCHDDGGHDGRTWDFTQRGEGFRNTTTLRGRSGTGHGRVHWTGNFDEIQDFEHDIRNDFGGSGFLTDLEFNTGTRNTPLGDPKAGVNADLDALADYVSSLDTIPPSPHRNSNGTMTDSALRGREAFLSLQCYTCHDTDLFTDSPGNTLNDVGTIQPHSGQRLGAALTGFDTPSLKGIWHTAPYLHDGSATSLLDVLTTANPGDQHGTVSSLTTAQRDDLIAYLRQLDDAESAAPGYDRWKHDHYTLDQVLAGAVSVPTGNDDGDSLNNFTEYVFGTDPNNPSGSSLTAIRANGDNTFSLTFEILTSAEAEVSIQCESSTTLQELSWSEVSLTETDRMVVGDKTRIELLIPAPTGGETGRFYRLKVTPN